MRVFTGAPEAQVNFTSLLSDYQSAQIQTSVGGNTQGQDVIVNPADAKSIPDKHHSYATYKKYLTPEKSLSVTFLSTKVREHSVEAIGFFSSPHTHEVIYLPLANSPPAVVSAHSLTYTTTAELSAVSENNFGEFKIYNGVGGLGSF